MMQSTKAPPMVTMRRSGPAIRARASVLAQGEAVVAGGIGALGEAVEHPTAASCSAAMRMAGRGNR